MEAPPGGGADDAPSGRAQRPVTLPQWRRPPEGARTSISAMRGEPRLTGRNGGAPRRGRGPGSGSTAGEAETLRRNGGAPRRGRGPEVERFGTHGSVSAAMEAPPGGGADLMSRVSVLVTLS